jgi:predicted nucleic acid-binding protein
MTLVDTNVLIDLAQDDPNWADWSEEQLVLAQKRGPLFINLIGYAELVPAMDTAVALDSFLTRAKVTVCDISRPAAYLAGVAFLKYRKQKGSKTGVLADFFIGAQAQTERWPLLTRDPGRYRTYFPKVKLICPH